MKKIVTLFLVGALMIASSAMVFAENAVSNMAVTNGGQALAECAKAMNKGISECAVMPECVK